ncbi:glutamate decarboxylase [Caerostris darwini]|uniref:Glutamate decarboxylase n=1 Tax=Caerostris darwini TaxID=1538125 RepID=A0AAV4UCP0_9ARAC|nr:glutamate decarboxylase [Caerostris darwini]
MKLTIHFDSQNNMNPLSSESNTLQSSGLPNCKQLLATKDITNTLQKVPRVPNKSNKKKTRLVQITLGLGLSNIFPLGKKDADENTRAFLQKVFEILLDFISKSNDRSAKILDFHQPNQLKEVLDLDIPDEPLNLDQLLVDCKDTLKYQVKTGM